jgi:hypothetical protein
MALIIETGAVIADADSFLTLVDARVLADNYGLTLPVDDTEAEVKLREGYRFLLTQESTLQGGRVSEIQTGIYPRTGVLSNCYLVASDFIPIDVKLAQLSASDSFTKGTENNSTTNGEKLKSFSIPDVYSETLQDGSSKSTILTISGVTNSLYPLTKAGLASSPCGTGGGIHKESMGFLG